LVHDPKILFLDEPTANLDPEAAKTVRDFVLELKKERRTIFLNTHNLDEAERLCDRIGILKTKLVVVDSPKNLERSLYNRRTVVHMPQVTSSILTAVKQLNFVKSVKSVDDKLVLDMDSPERDNPELVRVIVAAGGNIQYVTELRSTLEDVYLKLIREAPTA
jgi:ABC-2 type transport system ATP-binding protein